MAAQRSGQQETVWWRRLGESEWELLDASELILSSRRIVVDYGLAPGESAEYRVENRWLPDSPSFSDPVTLTRPAVQPDPVRALAAVSMSYQGAQSASKSWAMPLPSSAQDPAKSAASVRAAWGTQMVVIDPRLPDGPGTYQVGGTADHSFWISTRTGMVNCSDGVLEVRDSVTSATGQFYRADMTMRCTNPLMRADVRVGVEIGDLLSGFMPRPIGETSVLSGSQPIGDPSTRQFDVESELLPLDINAMRGAMPDYVDVDESLSLSGVDPTSSQFDRRVGWSRFASLPV